VRSIRRVVGKHATLAAGLADAIRRITIVDKSSH
jgi:hypothetical protein